MLTGLLWLGAALMFAAALVVWAALALASRCDDEQELAHLRWQEQRDAIARAVEDARMRP